MKIIKNEQEIVITAGCTSDDVIYAIAVLERLLKDLPVDEHTRFPKAMPREMFLARYWDHPFARKLSVEI